MSYDVDFMIDVVENSRKYKLELKRMKFLHSEINKVAKLVFMEFRKNVGKELIVEPPFIQNINIITIKISITIILDSIYII